MPTLQEAAQAHLAVPEEARFSEAPIAERLSSAEIAHQRGRRSACDEKTESPERRFSIVRRDFTHVSDAVSETLNAIAQSPKSVELQDLRGHQSLRRAIDKGLGWTFVPTVNDKGYVSRPIPRRSLNQSVAVERALSAAVWTAQRRLIPNVLHIRDLFPVPDPLGPKRRSKYLLEQLWIAVSTTHSNCLRLIAIELAFTEDDRSPESVARREGLIDMGYEVLCAIGWWALIDPMRFTAAILVEAGLDVPDRMRNLGPGSKIADYKCAQCGKLMIRDEAGYGIVEHRSHYVHEGSCFDTHVNMN